MLNKLTKTREGATHVKLQSIDYEDNYYVFYLADSQGNAVGEKGRGVKAAIDASEENALADIEADL